MKDYRARWGEYSETGRGYDATAEWHERQRYFARRFIGLGIFFVLAVGVGLALLGVLGFLGFVMAGQGTLRFGPAEAVLLFACLAVPMMVLMATAAAFAFRNVGSRLAEMMAAADAVAAGDFSVRVREVGRGDMAQFARRFNRMTAELARADRGRRNLTADVAHELRTPIQIIQGNLEGALDGVYEPTPEHLGATLEETRRLARLVGDLQTLSLAEAGQLPLHRRPVAAEDLLDDIVTRFMPQAVEAGVTLKAVVEGNPVIDGDPGRLEGVLANLTANALRHTPAGGRVTLHGAAVGGVVRLVVEDSGEGIPPDDLPHVFDRFWRGDRARSHAGGNTGLGLAIARQLVLAHGGAIDVTSAVGEGTTVTVELARGEEE